MNDNSQNSHNKELDDIRATLNNEKLKHQESMNYFNAKILENEKNINLKDTMIKSYEDTIHEQCNELQKIKELYNKTLAENTDLKIENESLESDIQKYLLDIERLKETNREKDKEISKLNLNIEHLNETNSEKDNEISKLNSIISENKTKSIKRSRTSSPQKKFKRKYEFSKPHQYENPFEQHNLDFTMNEENENLLTAEINQENILQRCIREKDACVMELLEYKQKASEYDKIIKDAEFVTKTHSQDVLSQHNFKLLFIGFFKYHFKKFLNPNKINLEEDDKKLLHDLKSLMENLSKSSENDYHAVLSIYVEQQINSLIGSFSLTDDNEANTVESFLNFTLNQIQDFITHIKINQELERLLDLTFSTYTASNITAFESIENIKNICRHLKQIFNVQFIREMELKLNNISNLIDRIYPKFKRHFESVEKEYFIEFIIKEFMNHLDENY